MQLRFYARGTGLVSLPGETRIVGQHPRYVGRALKLIDGAAAWPATFEPHVVGSDERAPIRDRNGGEWAGGAGSAAARLIKRCRAGELWPADAATAAACGVDFTALEFADGEWRPAAARGAEAEATKPKRASYQTTKD